MSTGNCLDELLLRWEGLLRQGRTVSAEELCRNCPELRTELQSRIDALLALDPMLGRRGDAEAAFKDGLDKHRQALARAGDFLPARVGLASHYSLLAQTQRKTWGELAEAVESVHRWQELFPDDPEMLYWMAGGVAECAALVGQGQPQLTSAAQDERRRYADETLALLRRAVEHGFRDAERLRGTKELEPVRERKDFQDLLAGLEERAKRDGK
jgi:hypothetical protein